MYISVFARPPKHIARINFTFTSNRFGAGNQCRNLDVHDWQLDETPSEPTYSSRPALASGLRFAVRWNRKRQLGVGDEKGCVEIIPDHVIVTFILYINVTGPSNRQLVALSNQSLRHFDRFRGPSFRSPFPWQQIGRRCHVAYPDLHLAQIGHHTKQGAASTCCLNLTTDGACATSCDVTN